ncbi:MAG: hypothetical protein ACRD8W_30620, partial [Nitrososphaeraceae archaeon]
MIILQLKSAHNESDIGDIEDIRSFIYEKYGYKIRGHEIHQSLEGLRKLSLNQSASLVTRFCSKNDIEYLTLHVPIPRNERGYLHNELSYEIANDSILATIREAEIIYRECGFKNKVVIVYHLQSVISVDQIPSLNIELKFRILEKAERNLIDFCLRYKDYFNSFAILTLENVFPKYFQNADDGNYATVNMFHPAEMIRLKKYGIMVTFDLSHYNIYSNHLSYEKNSNVAEIDRRIYGLTAPSWNDCLDLLGDSLAQLHINDGRGIGVSGEGLMLSEGEIPLTDILRYFGFGSRWEERYI